LGAGEQRLKIKNEERKMPLTLRKGNEVSSNRRVMSYSEEQFLKEKEKQIEKELKRGELQQGVNYEPKHVEILEKRLKELKANLNRYGAQRFSGQERVQAEKELKLIEERIRQMWGGNIPSYVEYWMRPKEGGIHYMNLVDKIVELEQSREYGELVRRWKYLRRRLEPENRRIDSILHLFKH
jgi:hypothetical protein